jgi:glutamine cyclotransferase
VNRPMLLLTIALAALLPLGAQAQNTESAPYHSSDTRKISKKLTSFAAKIGGNGTTLTADRDNKIWMVSNPETLRAIDGCHVKVKALVDVAQSQIRIVSVNEIADEQVGVRLHDAAFRR